MFLNYPTDCQPLFSGLEKRQKEIIFRRFGLTGRGRETLETIGQDLGLTRERVRQVVEATMSRLRKTSVTPEINKAFLALKQYLRQNGGLKRESLFFAEPLFDHQENSANWLYFVLSLEGSLVRGAETKNSYSFWALDKTVFLRVGEVLKSVRDTLTKEKKVLSLSQLSSSQTDKLFLKSALETAKEILRASADQYGLRTWPEVNPRGVRDLAYLVLKKLSKPLHFTEIASFIDELRLKEKGIGDFSQVLAGTTPRKTNFQTVHNELIKDPQFVLVGRGTYALREWGYKPGTVRDVISHALQEAKRPLSQKEVLKRVLSQRLVKENTILLNLGNKKYFLRSGDGRYSLREA